MKHAFNLITGQASAGSQNVFVKPLPAQKRLFVVVLFCHYLFCLFVLHQFISFFYNLTNLLSLFGFQPHQHWFAYDDLPVYWNFTERGKINFAGYGAPKRENNYAFCQVRKLNLY